MKPIKVILILLLILLWNRGMAQEQPKGSEIYEMLREMAFAEREQLIYKQFQSGNFPDFLLDFQEVTSQQMDARGKIRNVTIYVSPQYLSIGTKADHFIIPMGPKTAQRIALDLNAYLPTPKVVDMIYNAADLKLEPFTYIPRANRNETPDILYDHSRVIQAQMRATGYPPETFVTGHKKDIVISPKLEDKNRPRHVIIYGWHRLDGNAIQPESNIHINSYVDYSHGVRLISSRVLIDGKEYNYEEVLKDDILYSLLVDSPQPLLVTRY